ncbi:MAG: hypothetical protein JRN26_04645 [Nitrososphaerota archaeon]|jgi:hypothetical protein|nr:hypothetical protein [Nitrososphaerota archaeon]MDG6927853.1 hypothetical protein [Nitrososphaerota archaeon]MDG6931281.1 hypothetical protein [Nitrososphaerota archaeon]MDG6932148.1 hypothetical protein [Nitrososphaerota archaeon]MDG6936153.1 hypothetical protein [Nitrososphaerota archaeon]
MTEFFTRGKGENRKVIPINEKGLKNPRVMESPKFQEVTKDALLHDAHEKLKRISEMDDIEVVLTNLKEFSGFLGKYSPYNAALIIQQDPQATRVFSKDDWKALGYEVRENARPIAVLVPYGVPKKYSLPKIAKTMEKLKKEGQSEEYIIRKYNEMMRTQNARYTPHTYGVGRVYDAKSVNGDVPPEQFAKNSELYAAMKEAAKSKFKNITETTLESGSRGYTDLDTEGNVRGLVVMKVPNESKAPLNTLAHEMSHAIMGHDYRKIPRWKAETEAELSAYLVLSHYGVDFDKEAAAYIKNWLKDNKLGEESIDRAANTARQIIQMTDQHLSK